MVKKASTSKKGKSKSSASTKSVEVQKAAGKAKKVSVKKSKASKATKVTKAKATKAVAAAPAVKQEVVVNEQSSQVSSTQQSSGVTDLLAQLATSCAEAATRQKEIAQALKAFGRSYKREMKELQKTQNRSRRSNKKDPNRPKRAPSGFAVPSKISTEMCSFLGLSKGTELSRTDVTRKLTAYIRDKNLQVPTNRRSFVPDKALGSILGPLQEVDKEKGYTYFNLQRYITPHIVSNSASSSK